MEIPQHVKEIMPEIYEVSRFIYEHPELSSEEFKSSKYLIEKINEFCPDVQTNYLGIETSFKAELKPGKPGIALFAEYDALPLGHACGHNLIAAWGYGVFKALSLKENLDLNVILFGSPAEESRGKYASSKVIISKELKKIGVEAAFVVHPHYRWEVAAKYYARWRGSFIFKGKASHAAASPQEGINALDSAVNFYINLKMIKSSLNPNVKTVISEIIKSGGNAVNIIPESAEVWVDIRCSVNDYVDEILGKVKRAAQSCAASTGSTVEVAELAPFTPTFKPNQALDQLFYSSATKYVNDLLPLSESQNSPEMGSSDVCSVSQEVPTSQLLIKISNQNINPHSTEFLKAAGSDFAKESLIKAVAAGYDAVISFEKMRPF
jgi:amidohydrolase